MFYNLKSRETLDSKPSNMTFSKIEILNKNILYLTHTVDKCLVLLKDLTHDVDLQKQVDEYFEDDKEPEHIPEVKEDAN